MPEHQASEWEHPLAKSEVGVRFEHNVLVRTLLVVPLVVWIASLGLLGYFIRPSETPIVLHYNVYFGVDLLGIWWQAYLLPLLGAVFFIGHFFLARRFYRQGERIACYLMLLSSNMFLFGILIGSLSIVLINY